MGAGGVAMAAAGRFRSGWGRGYPRESVTFIVNDSSCISISIANSQYVTS